MSKNITMHSGWKRFRTRVVPAILACSLAAIGAVVASFMTGESRLLVLAAAALLAGSGVLAPIVADEVRSRSRARDALDNLRDARRGDGGEDRQIAALLDPHAAVVPFIGRDNERARLLAWCVGDQPGRLRMITGGGGVGKTRLALWLERELADVGWLTVWIRPGQEQDALSTVRAASRGRCLLIVDYAELRAGLEEMLRATASDSDDSLRVLFLARQAGDWWLQLQASEPMVRVMVAAADRLREDLAPAIEARVADIDMIRQAIPFFARQLGKDAPDPDLVTLVQPESAPRILDLHAAALLAVLAADSQPIGDAQHIDLANVLENLLIHERRYWFGRARALDLLHGPEGLIVEQLGQIVAAGTLLGAQTEGDAIELVGRVRLVPKSVKVVRWLRELYPPGPDEGWLGSLRPDRLAELHVASQLTNSPELTVACLKDLDERQARRALILLAQASADYPAAGRILESTLFSFPEAVFGLEARLRTLIAIANAIPYPSVTLGEAHVSIVTRIIAAYVPGTERQGKWLNDNCMLLSGLGRREEALAASEAAVKIYRDLTDGKPDAPRADLAKALISQSACLFGLGRPEDALAAVAEAAQICRELAEIRPDVFRADLSLALNNLSNCLSGLGRREAALAAVAEAAQIYRELTDAQPEVFRADLAMALNNLSTCLSDLDRDEEALAAAAEAAQIYRELAEVRPDAFRSDLAMALNNLSTCLSDLDRDEEALAAAAEAAQIYRELAEVRPDAFRSDLADALISLSNRLSETGRQEEALSAIEETVNICRELAQAEPEVFQPDLALALNNLSNRLSDLARRQEALAAIREAAQIYRKLAHARPDAFSPDLGMALHNMSRRLSSLGRLDEALTSIEEAIRIRRELAGDRPQVYGSALRRSLDQRADLLAALNRPA